ncbi:Scarecrow-like protein 15 [Platanthera zijinensis]|uniref:Scarecrow-like protein 15 n=1 Tax=Platanthera zijinensis TaxID=2320716 RepID=A0AAP0FZ99_9ASPA
MKIPKSSGGGGGGGGESLAVHRQLPKPIDSSPLYEPTSVLDPHLTSSPSAAAVVAGADLCPAFDAATATYFPWDQTSFPIPSISSASAVDDWPDSVSWLLGDTACPDIQDPCSLFPDLSQFPPSLPAAAGVAFDGSHLDLLLRAAHAIESGELNSAHAILARLNLVLPFRPADPFSAPLSTSRTPSSPSFPSRSPASEPTLSAVELVRRIAAHKALSDISPIPQFTAFTANQTLLETLDSAPSLHLIDFDLGLGSQWSSFAQEIAARYRAGRLPPPALRITAVVIEETAETTLAAENLCDFARGRAQRGAAFRGEAVAAVLTPAIFRLIGVSVLRFVRRAAARVVIFVDTECFGDIGGSFRRRFAGGLEYYAAAMEAVEAGAAAAGAGEESVRRIERAVFRPRIFSMAAAAAAGDWRDVMASAGMATVELSEFTESQAEWLLRRAPVDGFHVARREGALVVSWKGRELAATSAWRCR